MQTVKLPSDMPQCQCEEFRDAGYKIQSDQFPGIKQCRCGGFKLFNSQKETLANESGLHPLKHAVLVLPYEVEEVTTGGIILPTQVQERDQLAEQRAIIIEIGEQADCGTAQVGDRILFSKWSGQIAVGTLDGKKYRVINDRDIFLKIEDNKDV